MYASTFLSVFAFVAASAAAPWSDPTVCKPGTGYYQVCGSTGFQGCCTKDVCGMKLSYCPDTTTTTTTTTTVAPAPTHDHHQAPASAPGTCNVGFNYYVCANGFKGCCSQDACTIGYCPDNGAFQKVKRDPTVCAPGTGYYQVCGATGFKGCCTEDVCGKKLSYCPASVPAPAPTPEKPSTPSYPSYPSYPVQPANGVCPAGTGYYQVCANGFKGCCAKDACGLGYCPY